MKWYTDWKVRVGWSLGKYSGRSTRRTKEKEFSINPGTNRPRYECVCVCVLPCTRKQKSFHMSRRVSFVNPSASYSTMPLQHTHTLISILGFIWHPRDLFVEWTHEWSLNACFGGGCGWLTFQSGWERQRCTLSSYDSLGWHTAPKENKVEGSAHVIN